MTPLERLRARRWGDSWQTQDRAPNGQFGSGSSLDTSNLTGGSHVGPISNADAEQHLQDVLDRAKASSSFEADSHWYGTAHDEIGQRAAALGVDPQKFAGIVAATSPRCPWDTASGRLVNIDMAQKVVEIGRANPGASPHEIASQLSSPGMLKNSLTNGLRIYQGESPDTVLQAPKVRSFYNNLTYVGKTADVTVDTHMARILANDHSLGGAGAKLYMGSGTTAKGNAATYGWAADRIRAVAAANNMTPAQLQAATWSQWRREG